MSASLLTESTSTGIVARLEVGVSFKEAAVATGVSAETAKSWLARGRRDESGPCSTNSPRHGLASTHHVSPTATGH